MSSSSSPHCSCWISSWSNHFSQCPDFFFNRVSVVERFTDCNITWKLLEECNVETVSYSGNYSVLHSLQRYSNFHSTPQPYTAQDQLDNKKKINQKFKILQWSYMLQILPVILKWMNNGRSNIKSILKYMQWVCEFVFISIQYSCYV